MNQFEVAQGYIEQCQAGAPVGVLAHAFHFARCSHVDLLEPPRLAVTLHTCPKQWPQQGMFHEARRRERQCLQLAKHRRCRVNHADSFTSGKDRRVKKLSSHERTMRSVI